MHEAKTKLSQLVERAESGEEIVIARNGTTVAGWFRLASRRRSRPFEVRGGGSVRLSEDFDVLPEDIADAFGVR